MTDKELENMAREAAVAIGRDMKTNKFPFMSIMKQYGNFWAKDSRRYCLGDIIDIDEKKKYITIGY